MAQTGFDLAQTTGDVTSPQYPCVRPPSPGHAARAALTANTLIRPIAIAANTLPAMREMRPPVTSFNDMAALQIYFVFSRSFGPLLN
jgi:hypothetical protein